MSTKSEAVFMDLTSIGNVSLEDKAASLRLTQQLLALLPEDPMEIDDVKVSAEEQARRQREADLFKKVEAQMFEIRRAKTERIKQEKTARLINNPPQVRPLVLG